MTNIKIINDSGQGNQNILNAPNENIGMALSQIFAYNGNEVTFKIKNDVVFINATQMAKPFNSRPNDYFALKSTKKLIEAITIKNGIAINQLVIVERGGLNPSTWLHEDIALDFAQWLSVDFRLWCNDRLKELIKYGITATQPTLDKIFQDSSSESVEFAINTLHALKKEREEKAKLYSQIEEKDNIIKIQDDQLSIQAPLAKYTVDVLNSPTLIATTIIAKDLGFKSAESFNKELISRGILNRVKVNGCFVLNAKYSGKGYTHTKTHNYKDSMGVDQSSRLLYWTEKGRMFLIHEFSR